MKTTDVPGTFRDMWETRPSRPRDDRMVAGVASGIARRYDIDPVLVRVGFAVAAFTGIGALLYIACWITFPDTPAVPGEPKPKNHPLVVIAAIVAICVGIGGLFDNLGNLVLPLLAVAALLFLLHTSRGERGPVGPRPVPDPEAPAAATAGPSLVKDLPGMPPQPTPPSWDPLGAAPFAWDLPEPSSAEPPAPAPRKAPVTAVTLGLALLAAGVTSAIMLLTGTLNLVTGPTVLGVALAVMGTGLVVGSFLRAGRGIIPFAVLLSLITWGTLATPDAVRGSQFGDLDISPASVSQIQPGYTRAGGDIKLDLGRIDLSVPPGAPVTPVETRLSTGAGSIKVIVPANADVTFTGHAGIGEVSFAGRQSDDGPGSRLNITDLGADGVASGRPIVIDAQAGAGDVEVQRA